MSLGHANHQPRNLHEEALQDSGTNFVDTVSTIRMQKHVWMTVTLVFHSKFLAPALSKDRKCEGGRCNSPAFFLAITGGSHI